ncbi:MAG: hypothetical protein IJ501_06585 [Bacilli bacterium]|nr:hypothetical protein [Bacilli bacterium]
MEDRMRVSYDQIKKANEEIENIKLGNKGYAQVNERIKAFRKVYPTGPIETTIEEIRDDYVRIMAKVSNEDGEVLATGRASEALTGDAKKDYINKTSMIENCETSAVGRALGFAGFGVDSAIASAEDIERNKANSKTYEIYTNMFIREDDAIKVIKTCIADLMRKMGVVKASLGEKVQNELWTSLEEMGANQLKKLETKLTTLNMKTNTWHDLYNENLKIKTVVPIGQEVSYESSSEKFGKLALERAGTDEMLRNEIIDFYSEMGTKL